MARYYLNLNAQPNGDHEVHRQGCRFMPRENNRIDLGVHRSCREAVARARQIYKQSDGCAYCCPEAHTS